MSLIKYNEDFEILRVFEGDIVEYSFHGDVNVGSANEVLEILFQQFLYFCGCGQPEEAQLFYVKQLKSIVAGTNEDYIGKFGGLEFFKLCLVAQGFLTKDLKLTTQGLKVMEVIDFLLPYCDFTETDEPVAFEGDYAEVTHPLFQSEKVNDLLKTFWLELSEVKHPCVDVVPDINYTAGMYYLYQALGTLAFKTIELKFEQMENVVSNNAGAFYWTFYMTDNYLGWEAHGGSSPGWLCTHSGGWRALELLLRLYADLPFETYLDKVVAAGLEIKVGKEISVVLSSEVVNRLSKKWESKEPPLGPIKLTVP